MGKCSDTNTDIDPNFLGATIRLVVARHSRASSKIILNYFQFFLDESRFSQIYNLTKKTDKT